MSGLNAEELAEAIQFIKGLEGQDFHILTADFESSQETPATIVWVAEDEEYVLTADGSDG